ncbi:MAG: hypothetical protein WB565_13325 [Acidimicrobiales bacterium]
MPTGDGTEARLRHLAVTIAMVGVAIYVSVHLILAVVPALFIVGAVAGVIVVARLLVSRRRW